MELQISLGDGGRVVAAYDGLEVVTDQDGSAPAPFELFLASIGTCAGFYVQSFCRKRGIAVDGIRLVQRHQTHPETGMVEKIELDIALPADFPEAYRSAVVRAAGLCFVKKHLEAPPAIEVRTV